MAFTTKEKATILYHLGYPSKIVDPTSIEYNSIINGRFLNVPFDSENIARELLADIESLKAQLVKARCSMGTKQVADITLNPDEFDRNLKRELKRIYNELSELMNISYISKKLGSSSRRVRY